MTILAYVILYVPDVAASLRFYCAAFDLVPRFVHPSGTYAELNTGTTCLAFAHLELAREGLPQGFLAAHEQALPLGMEIGLTCDDVARAVAKAEAHGAVRLSGPTVKPWGQTVAYVRAPDGCLVELCTAMSDPLVEVKAAEDELAAAMLQGDVDVLDRLLSSDLSFVGPDGRMIAKAVDLELYRRGVHRISRLERLDARYQPMGEVVLADVVAVMQGEMRGQAYGGEFRYQRVWHRRAAGWQVAGGSVRMLAD
jgi:catechol 2,3-dioxygenase-like lactoylglutathione lyase family enzyme